MTTLYEPSSGFDHLNRVIMYKAVKDGAEKFLAQQ